MSAAFDSDERKFVSHNTSTKDSVESRHSSNCGLGVRYPIIFRLTFATNLRPWPYTQSAARGIADTPLGRIAVYHGDDMLPLAGIQGESEHGWDQPY